MRNSIYAILLITIFISCGKEEELSDYQLISSTDGKIWVIEEVVIDSTDVTSNIEPCVLDNERIFYFDKTYEVTEGDTTCSGRPEVAATGSWQFNEVKTTLKIAIDNDTTEYIIKELYKNQMKLFFIDQFTGNNVNWKLVTK